MSGRLLPVIGSHEPWSSGRTSAHVHCVLAPNPSAWTLDGTNTWLVIGEGASLVVDPGPAMAVHQQAVVDLALSLDAPIRDIVLTHGHPDHADGARALRDLTGAPVRAVDPHLRLGSEGLGHDSVVAVGDVELRVVATPGHTSDSVSLLLAPDDVLLTGDTVLGRGTAVIAWPDGELGPYLESLRVLRDVVEQTSVTALLPGHGPSLADPAGVLDAYVEHRRMRLAEVREAVESGATTAQAVVDSVYAQTPAEVRWAALMSVRAQLAYLATNPG